MYPKRSVYPPEGGEYCLEELRALQYCNDDDNGMEMTEVIHRDITTNIPFIQVCHSWSCVAKPLFSAGLYCLQYKCPA